MHARATFQQNLFFWKPSKKNHVSAYKEGGLNHMLYSVWLSPPNFTEAIFSSKPTFVLQLTHSSFDKFDSVHCAGLHRSGGFVAIKTSPRAEYPTDGALSVLNLDQRLGNARSKIITARMQMFKGAQGSAHF